MEIDYGSVLMAVGAAGAALCVTLAMNWLRQRAQGFLFTWATAMAVITASMAMFSAFVASGNAVAGLVACVLLVSGLTIGYAGMVHFRDGRIRLARLAGLLVLVSSPLAASYALGLDGAAFWLVNAISAGIVFVSGLGFWRMRAESVAMLSAIAALHWLLGFSFLLCAVVAVVEAPLYLVDGMPQNWAEVFNLVCGIVAITGIGALLVTVHQERISQKHQVNALTDPLTGLGNRRAFFEFFDRDAVPINTALIIFDLDDFKSLNDRFGHGFGDEVLCRFAALLKSSAVAADTAIRLGGEEFALVLLDSSTDKATETAERVRATFSELSYRFDADVVTCTVSAGVAVADEPDRSLDRLLRMADTALYRSKRNGRNRVTPVVSTAA